MILNCFKSNCRSTKYQNCTLHATQYSTSCWAISFDICWLAWFVDLWGLTAVSAVEGARSFVRSMCLGLYTAAQGRDYSTAAAPAAVGDDVHAQAVLRTECIALPAWWPPAFCRDVRRTSSDRPWRAKMSIPGLVLELNSPLTSVSYICLFTTQVVKTKWQTDRQAGRHTDRLTVSLDVEWLFSS